MTDKGNQYIDPENYWAGYQKSIDELKNKPEALEFDKLCYLVFETENGKRLLEAINERFLIPNLVPISSPSYQTTVTYYEGFKEGFRLVKGCIRSHREYINNNEGK